MKLIDREEPTSDHYSKTVRTKTDGLDGKFVILHAIVSTVISYENLITIYIIIIMTLIGMHFIMTLINIHSHLECAILRLWHDSVTMAMGSFCLPSKLDLIYWSLNYDSRYSEPRGQNSSSTKRLKSVS